MRRTLAAVLAAVFAFVSAPASAGDPYADAGFERTTLEINGKSKEALRYQGEWIGWPLVNDNYIFFKPHPLNKKAYWVMVSAGPDNVLNDKNAREKSNLGLYEADCSEGMTDVRQLQSFDDYLGKGGILENISFRKSDRNWTSPPPGSVGEDWLVYFCSRSRR